MATAAGPAAEKLAGYFDPPTRPTDWGTGEAPEAAPLKADTRMRAAFKQDLAESLTDAQHIARWAIRGYEEWPESWAPRVEGLYGRAAELVQGNVATVLAVAAELYRRGMVLRDRLREILKEYGCDKDCRTDDGN